MKKIIVLFIAVAMAAVMFAGCAQVNKASDTAAASSVPSAAASQQAQTGASAQAGGNLADILSSAEKMTNVSFDFSVSVSGTVAVSGSAWCEVGKMIKVKTTVSGIEIVEIIDQTNNTMTTYMPSTKTGQTAAAPADAASTNPGSYLEGMDQSKIQDLGTDTVNGYACRVIQFTSPADNTTPIKMWLSTELNFPVRITTTASGKDVQMDYTNVSTAAFPAGTFDIPSDIQITKS